MNVTIKEMAEKMRDFDEYVIVYHIRPDGDCIGSSFALALALQSIGKKCRVVGRDPVPQIHQFMTDDVRQDNLTNPVYISVDAVSPQRTGNYANQHFTFCIDHHRSNSIEADFKYVEEDCGACSEIIFKLLREMNVTINKQIADLLYTALVTDTRCFQTSDTSVQSFETAAALARLCADTYGISRRNVFVKSKGRRMIEDILKDSLHFSCGGRLITGIITQNDLKTADIADSELESINSYVEQYEEMLIGVTVRELPDGRSRCSTRTGANISADEICAVHGGGGHFHAAVCELNMPVE
ncbi:MAG: DHH family phosphoesterase, partial [Ruminococcus sp.]|nr:DHH family phosphoesterase [Ruminococcus sp.]